MFDPLEFFSGEKRPLEAEISEKTSFSGTGNTEEVVSSSKDDVTDEIEFEDSDVPMQVIDLPILQIAKPVVILTVLLLLRPAVGVNFSEQNGEQDDTELTEEGSDILESIAPDYVQETINWYKYVGNSSLDSGPKLARKLHQLAGSATEKDLVTYFTNVLAKYSRFEEPDELVVRILSEASLRISEKCGRTAQPAMTRVFQIKGLQSSIRLHEPALTADNLGLKTWGASLVLAQKLCQKNEMWTGNNHHLRVLELGAGTGLVGIALLKKLCEIGKGSIAASFHLTDLPEIVPNLKKNVQLNNCDESGQLEVFVDVLDWTDPSSFESQHGCKKFDVVLIADPIYSPQHPEWIVNMMTRFLAPHGTAYLEVPVRAKYAAERQTLWDLIDKANLEVGREETNEGVDDWGQVSYLYKEVVFKRPL
ncbi:LAFA_0F11958g1_1 [Lachancea sp. 'fantastica']|nr:LAFA_0F11958g1_1 [Lachancea sp. 'fantastica']